MNERVTVSLGDRSYHVHVGKGLLEHAGRLLGSLGRGSVVVVADSGVAPLYLEAVHASLSARKIAAHTIVVPEGEASKSFAGLERLTGELLNTEIGRDGLVVALGGGVVGDLVGFASGVLKRGVDFVQIPTTLLAQVDSSVGGKTAINTSEGKNLVGMFHQPRLVIADVGTLRTLPRRELLSGYAEVVKYGALGDADFFAWLEAHGAEALAGDEAALTHVVAHSVAMKANIVARDERESGDRALLNLGHTFGHALEAATGYSQRLLHGEGVAIGMGLAFRLSALLGHAAESDAARITAHLGSVGLPARLTDIPGGALDREAILRHMMHDKKVKDGTLTFVLARGIGHAFLSRDVPLDAVRAVLAG